MTTGVRAAQIDGDSFVFSFGMLLFVKRQKGVKFALPNVFWTRLAGKYGTTFYVKENGMDVAIENAVEAIVSCLRNDDGYCVSPPDEGQSLKSLGMK
jgi:hypothetical protein